MSITLATLTKKKHTHTRTHGEDEIIYEHKTTKKERKDSEMVRESLQQNHHLNVAL